MAEETIGSGLSGNGKNDMKVRNTTKDVKGIDRTKNLARHTKETYVRTRQNAKSVLDEDYEDASEYAVNRSSEMARDTAEDAGRGAKNTVKKAEDKTREKVEKHIQKKYENKSSDSVSKIKTRDAANKTQSIRTRTAAAKNAGQTAGKGSVKTAEHTIKGAQKGIKSAQQASKAAVKTAQKTGEAARKGAEATAKASEKMVVAAQKAAVAAEKATVAAVKAIAAAIKAAAAVVKEIAASAGAGIVAGLPIIALAVVIMAVAVLLTGDTAHKDTSKMSNAQIISGINKEWQTQMDEISSQYDNVTIEGSRATWPEVFSIYNAVAVGENEPRWDKNVIINQVFWKMHTVTCDASLVLSGKTAAEKDIVIPFKTIEYSFVCTAMPQVVRLENVISQDVINIEDYAKPEEGKTGTTKITLNVHVKSLDEMAEYYDFSDWQKQQAEIMMTDEFDSFWMEAIYGIIGGDGDIVNVALTQVGNVGGYPYWAYVGFPSRVEWCACFVSWCAGQCGYVDAGLIPNTGSPPYQVQFFRQQGRWLDGSATPAPGMIIFFDWYNADFADHVGIVEKVEGNTVYTIEGNSSDSVRQKTWMLGDSRIMGYGYIEK